MIELPEFLQEKARSAPESSYGVVTITVVLKDGRRFDDVKVAWGHQIVKCQGSIKIPFLSKDIQDIELGNRTGESGDT